MVSVPLRDKRRGGEGGVTLLICISSHLILLLLMIIIFIINFIEDVDDDDDDDVWHDTASASHSGLGTRFPPTQLLSSLLFFLFLYLQIFPRLHRNAFFS